VANLVTLTTINSSKNAASYLWDFGDGATSTQQNPTHTYSLSGVCVVRLVASGAGGSSTVEQAVPVQTGAPLSLLATDLLQQLTDDQGNSLYVT
jgi:PKD repeat protein